MRGTQKDRNRSLRVRLAVAAGAFMLVGCQVATVRHVERPQTAREVIAVLPSVPAPAPVLAASVTLAGNISQAVGLGDRYLAIRAPRGTATTVCAATCVTLKSTDYGPSSRIRPPRIADLAIGLWIQVCRKPASAGLCYGTITYGGAAPNPTSPPTDFYEGEQP